MGGGDLTVKALAAFAGRSRDKIKLKESLGRPLGRYHRETKTEKEPKDR